MNNTTIDIDQLAWMRDQLARYTYRPGWRLTIAADTLIGEPFLRVKYQAPDSRDPDRIGQFEARRPLGFYIQRRLDPDAFARDIQRALFDIERHESREWLRRDGVLFDDPHADPSRWTCGKCGGVGPIRHEGNSWTCPGCHTPTNAEEGK